MLTLKERRERRLASYKTYRDKKAHQRAMEVNALITRFEEAYKSVKGYKPDVTYVSGRFRVHRYYLKAMTQERFLFEIVKFEAEAHARELGGDDERA
jgi:hypothetical protein